MSSGVHRHLVIFRFLVIDLSVRSPMFQLLECEYNHAIKFLVVVMGVVRGTWDRTTQY